jgi:hypothetical protein
LDLKKNYEKYSQAIDRFREKWKADVEDFHQKHISALLQK